MVTRYGADRQSLRRPVALQVERAGVRELSAFWRALRADVTAPPAVPADPTEELDCLTCSACCRGHAGVIPVSASDLVRFRSAGRPELALRIVPGHFGDEAMETSADGACVHLGRPGLPHHCSIYDVRPDICGEFERGSWQCHEARRFDARFRSC